MQYITRAILVLFSMSALVSCSSVPSPRRETAVSMRSHQMITFGGKSEHNVFDELWSFDVENDAENSVVSDLWLEMPIRGAVRPGARWKACGIVDTKQEHFYVVFGSTAQGYSFFDDIWRYDFARDIWQQVLRSGATFGRRAHACNLVVDEHGVEHILIWGGRDLDNNMIIDMDRYTPSTGKYVTINSYDPQFPERTPPGRKGHVSVVLPDSEGRDEYLYIHGGRDENDREHGYHSDTWRYHIKNNTWEEVKGIGCVVENPMGGRRDCEGHEWTKIERNHHIGRPYGKDSIYVWGGRGRDVNLDDTIYGDLWMLDIGENKWVSLPILSTENPSARFSAGYTHHGEHALIMFGGDDLERSIRNDVWMLDVETKEWTLLAKDESPDHTVFWAIVIATNCVLGLWFVGFMIWRHRANANELNRLQHPYTELSQRER
eukprot:Rmarinus@m.8871